MRQGQPNQHHNNNNKRMRNRNRKGPNPLTRSYESNGGDVKIRGTALHVAEKYVQLARDAQSSGDRVAGENYLQHAEHYYRIVAAAQAQMPQPQQVYRNDEDGEEGEDGGDEFGNNPNGNNYSGNRQQNPQAYGQGGQQGGGQQGGGHQGGYGQGGQGGGQGSGQGGQHRSQTPQFTGVEPQPFVNANGVNGDAAGNGGQDQPPLEGQDAPQGGQGGQGGDERGFRPRRRRPYREQYGDRGNAAPEGSEVAAEAPTEE